MTASDTDSPPGQALADITNLVRLSRDACRDAIDAYELDGPALVAAASAQLQRYRDSTKKHEPRLVAEAERLERDIVESLPRLIEVKGMTTRLSDAIQNASWSLMTSTVSRFQENSRAMASDGTAVGPSVSLDEALERLDRIFMAFFENP